MIAAIVILYYPNPEIVNKLLSSLATEVNAVFAIDNTPGSNVDHLSKFQDFSGICRYVPLGKNIGIAAAQNIGIDMSIRDGYSHVLLLDQDSILFPNMVQKMFDAEQRLAKLNIKIGAIGPLVVDRRSGVRPAAARYHCFFVRTIRPVMLNVDTITTDNLLASGSLIRADTFVSVGQMREDLFIEHVDTEWAFRAGSMGYKHYCVCNASISHCLGERSKRVFGKDIYLYDSLRYQYKLRNAVFLLRLRTMGWHWRLYTITRIPYHLIVYTIFSKKPARTFRLLLVSIWNGMRGNLGEISPDNQ
ncbi:MAG: glycosyltransferase family 2 protein [Acidobacteriaceae bacterium]|nr:glycosyltransferase family 2 protein [Acidobacteriaceae bacterium]